MHANTLWRIGSRSAGLVGGCYGRPVERVTWGPVIDWAAQWIEDQQLPVTLRQVFYALVSAQLIPNSRSAYKKLSQLTAERRRVGAFPAVVDGTREIQQAAWYFDLADYVDTAARGFQLDRTAGQEYNVIIGVEKRGMGPLQWQQFGPRGYPIVACGGYTSATIDMDLSTLIADDPRPAVLLYAGDFDASGADILRNLVRQVDGLDQVVQVALTRDQVEQFGLPLNYGKASDSRAAEFSRRNGGDNWQVEVDALTPQQLVGLFTTAAAPFWDMSTFDAVVTEERQIQATIRSALTAAS